jgi:hypothetical protein
VNVQTIFVGPAFAIESGAFDTAAAVFDPPLPQPVIRSAATSGSVTAEIDRIAT